jgi:hypothetical protein
MASRRAAGADTLPSTASFAIGSHGRSACCHGAFGCQIGIDTLQHGDIPGNVKLVAFPGADSCSDPVEPEPGLRGKFAGEFAQDFTDALFDIPVNMAHRMGAASALKRAMLHPVFGIASGYARLMARQSWNRQA